MTRILADLSEEDVKWLDAQAEQQGKSRAQLLREAVAAFKAETSKQGIEKFFGIWRERKDIGDPVEWQRRDRASWTRPWDADYWDVRKEFPDLFDANDDREAERYRSRGTK